MRTAVAVKLYPPYLLKTWHTAAKVQYQVVQDIYFSSIGQYSHVLIIVNNSHVFGFDDETFTSRQNPTLLHLSPHVLGKGHKSAQFPAGENTASSNRRRLQLGHEYLNAASTAIQTASPTSKPLDKPNCQRSLDLCTT